MTTTTTHTTTYSATLPSGEIVSRTSEKHYIAVLAARKGEVWSAFSWAATDATLGRRTKDAAREGYDEVRVVMVESSTRSQAAEQPASYDPTHAAEAGQLVNVAPIISLRIVRDAEIATPRQIKTPADIFATLAERFADSDREQFVVVCLDTKNRVIAVNVAFIGTLNSVSITLREVFKAACVVGAAAIVVSHNHPSGDPTPSPEDVLLTRKIREAGQLLDIELLDHVTLGSAGRWVSFRERGLGF